MLPRRDVRYVLWGVALLGVALLPLFAGFAGFAWELAQVAGLIGALACIVLTGAPLRPRAAQPPTLIGLRWHNVVGWIALGAVAVHVGVALLAEPHVVEFLKVSTPRYQLAGIVAFVLLLFVVVSAQTRLRRRWKSHRGFQATHIVLACLLLVLTAVHVAVTNRYAGGYVRRLPLIAALAGALLMLLRRGRGTPPGASLTRRLVFGRHAWLVMCVSAATAVVSIGLYAGAANAAWREPLAPLAHQLPLDFPHAKHVKVNCLACHHNFADSTGGDRCIGCHESQRTDLKFGVEARMHDFCFECHRHPDASLDVHGPVSGCAACHHKPQ